MLMVWCSGCEELCGWVHREVVVFVFHVEEGAVDFTFGESSRA